VYGAERRGAPMAAFPRIARDPIRERGLIGQPDLVVIADDTLLADLAVQALGGCDSESTMLINSTVDETELRKVHPALTGQVLVADFTR
jgi:pyruvate ferredoxin oxidoreductase gamma subunit